MAKIFCQAKISAWNTSYMHLCSLNILVHTVIPYIASCINRIRQHVVVTVQLTESIRHKVVYWKTFLYISTHFEASYHTWTRKERFYDIVLQLYTLMSLEYNTSLTRWAPNITLGCSKEKKYCSVVFLIWFKCCSAINIMCKHVSQPDSILLHLIWAVFSGKNCWKNFGWDFFMNSH